MRRAFGTFEVDRRHREARLGELLQGGLGVALGRVHVVDVREMVRFEEARHPFDVGLKVECGEIRLEHVGQHRGVGGPAVLLHPDAEAHDVAQIQPAGRLGAGITAHDRGPAAGQLPLAGVRVLGPQPPRGEKAQNRVAEELQPLVRRPGALARGALVHEGLLHRRRVQFRRAAQLEQRCDAAPMLGRHGAQTRRSRCGRRSRSRSKSRPRPALRARRSARNRGGIPDRDVRS